MVFHECHPFPFSGVLDELLRARLVVGRCFKMHVSSRVDCSRNAVLLNVGESMSVRPDPLEVLSAKWAGEFLAIEKFPRSLGHQSGPSSPSNCVVIIMRMAPRVEAGDGPELKSLGLRIQGD